MSFVHLLTPPQPHPKILIPPVPHRKIVPICSSSISEGPQDMTIFEDGDTYENSFLDYSFHHLETSPSFEISLDCDDCHPRRKEQDEAEEENRNKSADAEKPCNISSSSSSSSTISDLTHDRSILPSEDTAAPVESRTTAGSKLTLRILEESHRLKSRIQLVKHRSDPRSNYPKNSSSSSRHCSRDDSSPSSFSNPHQQYEHQEEFFKYLRRHHRWENDDNFQPASWQTTKQLISSSTTFTSETCSATVASSYVSAPPTPSSGGSSSSQEKSSRGIRAGPIQEKYLRYLQELNDEEGVRDIEDQKTKQDELERWRLNPNNQNTSKELPPPLFSLQQPTFKKISSSSQPKKGGEKSPNLPKQQKEEKEEQSPPLLPEILNPRWPLEIVHPKELSSPQQLQVLAPVLPAGPLTKTPASRSMPQVPTSSTTTTAPIPKETLQVIKTVTPAAANGSVDAVLPTPTTKLKMKKDNSPGSTSSPRSILSPNKTLSSSGAATPPSSSSKQPSKKTKKKRGFWGSLSLRRGKE